MRITHYLPQFWEYLQSKNFSPQTIKSYKKHLTRFVKEIGDLSPQKITLSTISQWVQNLSLTCQRDYIINCLWSLRSFLRFLRKNNITSLLPEKIEIPHRQDKNILFLNTSEIQKILNFLNQSNIHYQRLRAYIVLLLTTGMRPQEALNLKRSDIYHSEIEIIGKNKKKRRIYIDNITRQYIFQYLKKRKDNCPALFVTHCKAQPVNLRTLEDNFCKIKKILNLNKNLTFYTLRHTFATNLFKNGCPMEYIQILLGHSKIETTRKYYVACLQEDAKKARFKFLNLPLTKKNLKSYTVKRIKKFKNESSKD